MIPSISRLVGLAGALALAFSFGRTSTPTASVAQTDVPRALDHASAPEAPLAQNTSAFTYQGQLKKNGAPVSASCNASFKLYDAASGGAQIGGTVTSPTMQVVGGAFAIALDFGWVFNGEARWLETAIGCAESQSTLSPRTALRPAPYAFALPGLRTAPGNNDLGGNPTMNVIGGVTSGSISNTISSNSFNSAIVGGNSNRIANNSELSIIGGGERNVVTTGSGRSVLAGGYLNQVDGSVYSAVGGGYANRIVNSADSAIAGGYGNVITSANFSMIPGGEGNRVEGEYAFAAGRSARAVHDGAFVWNNSFTPVSSTAANQFVINASGGIRLIGSGLNSTTSPSFIHQAAPCAVAGLGLSRTAINHPLANANPNAILLVTPNYGDIIGGSASPSNPIGVYYDSNGAGGCPVGRWVIYDLKASTAFDANMRFNVLIVSP